MRRVVIALAATVSLLAGASTAAAESVFIPQPVDRTAPLAAELAGDRLVWVEHGPELVGTLRVVSADLATRRQRTLAVLGDRDNLSLEDLIFHASASLAEVYAQFDEGSVYAFGPHDDLRPGQGLSWDIDGDRSLSVLDIDHLRVTDHATGETKDVALAPARFGTESARLGGDLVGYTRDGKGSVVDGRTGAELMRFDWPNGWIADLEPDGTALWGRTVSPNVRPDVEYRLSIDGELGGPLPIPRDHAALLGRRRVAYDDAWAATIVVLDAAGRRIAAARFPRGSGHVVTLPQRVLGVLQTGRVAAFDGRRVVFSYTPCVGPVVAVWDIDAGPLAAPQACHAARVAGRVTAPRRNVVRVPLRCRRVHVTGCPTDVTVRTRGASDTQRVDLRAGERRGALVPLRAGRKATIVTAPGESPAAGERRRTTVRVHGA